MEKIRYFKYLFFFLEKSLEIPKNLRYTQSNRRFSNVISPYSRRGGSPYSIPRTYKHSKSTENDWKRRAYSPVSYSREHEHINNTEDRRQLTSKKRHSPSFSSSFKSGSSCNSDAKFSDYYRQKTSICDKNFPESSTLEAQKAFKKESHYEENSELHSRVNPPPPLIRLDNRDLIPNTSEALIQNINSYSFDSLNKLHNDLHSKSTFDYVKQVQSDSKKNDGFKPGKFLPELHEFFFTLIQNFFSNENCFNSIPDSSDIFKVTSAIFVKFSEREKINIFNLFCKIINQLLYLDDKCKNIIDNNFENIVSKLLEAYVLNLFYYMLDYDQYRKYLFNQKRFCLSYMSFECTIISRSYFYRTEAERVKELFTQFKLDMKERMENAKNRVLDYLDSKDYSEVQSGAIRLFHILFILVRSNIENISFPKEFHRFHPEYALEEKNYLSNETSSSEFEPSNFIGIISQTQSVFLLKYRNREFYFDRFYQSYLIFLIYAHNKKKDDLRLIISELEKYLDCFPQFLLKRKNFVIFKYLFGFYEEELNDKFIPVFFKIIDSVIYHINHSEIDDLGYSASLRYHKRLARQTLWFMNKLGRQLQNKFAKKKSNYFKFWKAYNEAYEKASMRFLLVKADFFPNEIFEFSEKQVSISTPTQFANNLSVGQFYSIPDVSFNNIFLDDILDEFWYLFEIKYSSFNTTRNLIFPEKSSNEACGSSSFKIKQKSDSNAYSSEERARLA